MLYWGAGGGGGSSNNTINSTTSVGKAGVIGSLLKVGVEIKGVPVKALLDTGAQSTIISRSTLHAVVRHLQEHNRPVPELEIPTARLYGKDGQKGGKALYITAQVAFTVSFGSKGVTMPVFVQPDSEQACLHGMNAIPLLGIEVRHCDGTQILPLEQETDDPPTPAVCSVSLLTSTVIGLHKGCVIRAQSSHPNVTLTDGDFLFEPSQKVMEGHGLSAMECLVTAREGKVSLPVENFQEFIAHMDAGEKIAILRPLDSAVVTSLPEDDTLNADTSTVNVVDMVTPSPERLEELHRQLQLPFDKLTQEERGQLEGNISEFSDVFALTNSELGRTSLVRHSIETGTQAPIRQQPYRTPVIRWLTMNEMVQDMQKHGVVQPSSSPWASPVVLVPKKDGTLRFCIDYRRLNSVTRKDVYSLPRVDDILTALEDSKYFSSLDLASGYWQIELDDDARKKSAFTTYNGLFEFLRMLFGCHISKTHAESPFRIGVRVLLHLFRRCPGRLQDI